MKKVFFFSAMIVWAVAATSQSIIFEPQVISTSGNSGTAGNNHLSWTIGQPVGFAATAGSTLLTQGFQQPASCMPYQDEDICIVSVDTLTSKNKILWQKTPNVGTMGYIVYKEGAANHYDSIAYVPYSATAEFVDYLSTPESSSERYKIRIVDTCGNRSLLSPYHQTINLQISQGVPSSVMSLNWTPYVDETGTYIPDYYYIYRGTQPDNMVLHDSISGNQTMKNDIDVFGVYYYRLAIRKYEVCDGGKSVYTQSFSNRKDNYAIIVGIQQLGNSGEESYFIKIHPNPFTESTTLTFSNPSNALYQLTLTDITGKVVKEETITGNTYMLNRGMLQSGMYFVEISGERVFRGKVVVE